MENRRKNINADIASQIASIVPRLKISEPLKYHTTFRIGGPARYFAVVENRAQLKELYIFSRKNNIALLLLGSGSNILAGDNGFNGIVIRLEGEFSSHRFEDETLYSGAGARLSGIVAECTKEDLSGVEILCGIPGTLGGALITNAGTREEGIGNLIENVEVLSENGKYTTINKKDLHFKYRESNLGKMIITGAALHLKKGIKNDILTKVNSLLTRRIQSQPAGAWCAGSVFKNPENDSAGRLIESCGLKGLTFGGAKISDKHANFIVNSGSATANDVRTLITIIHDKVKEKCNVSLELEMKIAGE